LAVATVLVVGAAACGGDDDAASDDAPTTEQPTAAASGDGDTGASGQDTAAVAGGAGAPCDVTDAATVEAVLGQPLGEGDAGQVSVTENDLSWTAEACDWETDAGLEIELRMVAADALPGECPRLSSPVYEVTEVPGLGDAAWFEFDDLQGEGGVRACAAAGMVEARIESGDTPVDEATLEATAVALVTPAIAAL
jgi:hypothetical protein